MGKPVFRTKKSFEGTKSFSNDRAPKISDVIDVFKPTKEYEAIRYVGPTVSYGMHWVETIGKDGKKASFGVMCSSYDSETEDFDPKKPCAWCKGKEEGDPIRFSPEYYTNAIIRSLQEDEPARMPKILPEEAKSGFKKKGSKSWSPMRATRSTSNMVESLKKLSGLNRRKGKDGETRSYPLVHPKYGCDVNISYDKDAKSAAQAYSLQKGDRSPLTDVEEGYLMQPLEDLVPRPTPKESQAEYKKWHDRFYKNKKKARDEDDDDTDDDDDDEDTPPKSSKGKSKKPAKKSSRDEDDDDDLDDDDDENGDASDDDDDDEDDTPKSKKKKAAPKKKSKSDDDDEDEDSDSDEDDDDDSDSDSEEDDDEDDEPPKKKGKAAAKSSKSRKKASEDDSDDDDDEDDDEDDDDSDEDDDDDEPVKKSKKKPVAKGKKKPAADLDDDDELEGLDDDDSDEDDDDEPKPKKKKPAAKKSTGKKKKPVDDDDDEDDDLDD